MNERREAFRKLVLTLKSESAVRRLAHPDWPCHTQTYFAPGEPPQSVETMPIAKLPAIQGYCKYCYDDHGNWWLMDQRNYRADGKAPIIVLCGNCGHTSAAEHAGIVSLTSSMDITGE